MRWDSLPDRLVRLPLYRDESGQSVAMPPEGRACNAWPVARALAEGARSMRSYSLQSGGETETHCYRVMAYPIEIPR